MINVPANFITDIQANMSALFSDFSGFITLVVGVLLGLLVIGYFVSLLRH